MDYPIEGHLHPSIFSEPKKPPDRNDKTRFKDAPNRGPLKHLSCCYSQKLEEKIPENITEEIGEKEAEK